MWRLCMLLSTQRSSWFYTKVLERPLWTYCAATSDHQIHQIQPKMVTHWQAVMEVSMLNVIFLQAPEFSG